MERLNRKAEDLLKILLGNLEEVYIDGDVQDYELSSKYIEYLSEYKELLNKGYVKHPVIPLPDDNGDVVCDYSDSVVTPKGKAYLEDLARENRKVMLSIIAWSVTTLIAIVALIISIIAL